VKLSPRLNAINQLVTEPYTHIWDCCCDHGFLGAHLLQQGMAETVHFVDSVPSICQQLENKLARFSPPMQNLSSPQWQVHCADVATLKLADCAQQLVIIAGVGGELCSKLLAGLLEHNAPLDFDIIVCPVHEQFQLRQFLITKGLRLVSEQIVEDKQRYYEVLHLSRHAKQPLTSTGKMWDLKLAAHQHYLGKTIKHYQQRSRSITHPALQAYLKIQQDTPLT